MHLLGWRKLYNSREKLTDVFHIAAWDNFETIVGLCPSQEFLEALNVVDLEALRLLILLDVRLSHQFKVKKPQEYISHKSLKSLR